MSSPRWALLASVFKSGASFGLNSWDAVVHPVLVVDAFREQLFAVPVRTVEALLALVAFLLLGYLAVYSSTGLNLELDRDD